MYFEPSSSPSATQVPLSELIESFRAKELQYKLEIEKLSELVQNLRKEYSDSLEKILENKESIEHDVHVMEINSLRSEIEDCKTKLQSLLAQSDREKKRLSDEISKLKESEALLLKENILLKKRIDELSTATSPKTIPREIKSPAKAPSACVEPPKVDFPAVMAPVSPSNSPQVNSLRRSVSLVNQPPASTEICQSEPPVPQPQSRLGPSTSYIVHPQSSAPAPTSSVVLSSPLNLSQGYLVPWGGTSYYIQQPTAIRHDAAEDMKRSTSLRQYTLDTSQPGGLSRSVSYVGAQITPQPVYQHVPSQSIDRSFAPPAVQQPRTLQSSSSLRGYTMPSVKMPMHHQFK